MVFQRFDDSKAQLVNYILYSDGAMRKVTSMNFEGKTTTEDFVNFFSTDPNCQPYSTIQGFQISSTHASAVIDLNMDCRPDLWIESNTATGMRAVEMYFMMNDGKFCLVYGQTMKGNNLLDPLKSSSFSFFDLLRNGDNSALFLDDANRLHIMNNIYDIPNPDNAASPLCTPRIKLDDATKKHLPPFEGFASLASQFTAVWQHLT